MSGEGSVHGSRWEVQEQSGSPTGGLYELEIRTIYRVADRESGRVVLTREGLYEASFGADGNWGEGTTTGVVDVQISADDRHALVRNADGTVERVSLPPEAT